MKSTNIQLLNEIHLLKKHNNNNNIINNNSNKKLSLSFRKEQEYDMNDNALNKFNNNHDDGVDYLLNSHRSARSLKDKIAILGESIGKLSARAL